MFTFTVSHQNTLCARGQTGNKNWPEKIWGTKILCCRSVGGELHSWSGTLNYKYEAHTSNTLLHSDNKKKLSDNDHTDGSDTLEGEASPEGDWDRHNTHNNATPRHCRCVCVDWWRRKYSDAERCCLQVCNIKYSITSKVILCKCQQNVLEVSKVSYLLFREKCPPVSVILSCIILQVYYYWCINMEAAFNYCSWSKLSWF